MFFLLLLLLFNFVSFVNLNSDIEKDELARRTVQWLYYLLRSPFFEFLTGYDYSQFE